MQDIAHTAHDMLANMTPVPRDGRFVFASVAADAAGQLQRDAIAMFAEEEGLSLILPLEVAQRAGLDVSQPMSCITLNVYSSLEGVGLTAAVATLLADHGIACNMVAACHHDHVFVPAGRSAEALALLQGLQNRQSAGSGPRK